MPWSPPPRASKTRQLGAAPPPVQSAGLLGHPLDPVAARLEHLRLNRLEGTAMQVHPAFSYLRTNQVAVPMLHADLVHAAKSMAGLQGVDTESVAGHSFRRGGVSHAFRAGVPDVLIQRQCDWQSMRYREYLTLPAAKALEATRAMYSLMLQPSAEGGLGASVLQAGLEPMDNAVGGCSTL
eukprot:jgi/Ulvmu1/6360/UM029_0068.1